MKKMLISALFAIPFLFCNSFAQESIFSIGLKSEFQYLSTTSSDKATGNLFYDNYFKDKSTSGTGYRFGAVSEIKLPVFTPNSKISFGISYSSNTSEFSHLNINTKNVIIGGLEQTLTTKEEIKAEYEVNSFTIDLLFKENLYKDLYLFIGPRITNISKANLCLTTTIISPSNVEYPVSSDFKYSDDHKTIYIYDGDVKEINKTIFGLNFGFQYDFKIGDKFEINPYAGACYNFDNISKDYEIKELPFNFGVEFMYKM